MRSFTDAVQGTFTERAGGKMIEKGLSKVLPFEKMWNHRIAGRTVSNDIIQSPFAETSEEYLGAIMDFIRSYNPLYSDQSNSEKRAGADEMFTGEGFAVTAGSVLPMSIFGGVSNSVKIHNTASKFRSAKSDLTNYLQKEGVIESDCRDIIRGIESSDNGIDFVNKCNIVYSQLDAQWLQQHPEASLEEAKQHQKELSAIIKNYLSKAIAYDESVQDINLHYSKLTDEEKRIIDDLFSKSLQKHTPSKASVEQKAKSPEPNSASEPSVSIPEGDNVSAVVSIKNTDGSVSVLPIQSFDGFEYDADGAIDLRATAEKHTASITIDGEQMTLKDALSSNLISSESEAMTTKSYYDQQRAAAEQANKAEAQQRAAAEQAKQAEAAAPKIDEVPIGTNEQVFATTLEDGVVEMGESRDEQGNIVYFKSEGKANDAINKLKKKSFFSNYDFELVPVQVGTRGTGVYAEPVNVYKIAAKARQETSEVVEPEVNNEESSSSPVEETSVAYWSGEPVEMIGEAELDGRVYMRVRLGNGKEKLVTKDNLFDSGGVQLYPKEKKQKPVDYLKDIGSREADISGISEQLLSKYGAEIAEEVVRDSYTEAIDKRDNAKGALQRGDARIEAENWKLVGRAMGIELGEDLGEGNKNNNIVKEKENDNGIRTTIDTESQRGIQVEDEKQRAYADRERQETKEFSEPITANTPQSDVYEDDVTSLLPKEDADNYRAAVLSSDIETLNGFYIRALNGADKTKSELDAKRAELDKAVDIIDKVLINKDLKKLEKRLINERALYTGVNNKIQEIKKQIHNGEAAVEVAPQTTPSDVRVSEPEATTLSDLQDFGRLTAAHYSEERESRYNRMAAELGEPPLKGESSFKSFYTEEKSEPVKPTTTTYYEPKNAFFPEEKTVSSGNSSLSVLDNALDNEDASGVRMAKKSKDNKRSGDRVYVVYDISEGVPRGYESIDSDCEIAYRDNETAGVFSRVGDKTVLLDTSGKLVTGSLELYTDNEGIALGKSRIRSNAKKLLNADTVQASLDKQLVIGKDAQGNSIRVSISDLLTKDYEIDDEYRDAVKTELVKSVGIINSTLRRNGFDTLLDSDFSTRGKHTNTAVRQNASKRKRNSDIISAIKSSGDIEFSMGNGTLTGANELSSEEAEIESEDIRFLIKKDLVGDGVLSNLAEKYWDSGIAAVVNNAKSIEELNDVLDNLSDGIVEHYMEKRARINPKRARAEVATVQNTNPREMAAAANRLGVVYQVNVDNYSDEDIKIMIAPVEEELTKSRKSIGNKWNDILKNYSSAERFIVLKSLYQFISKQSEAYPIGYIQQPFEETMREFKESGSPATFNFYQSYNENIINYIGEDKNAVVHVKSANGISGTWVKMNKASESKNVVETKIKVAAASNGTSWCTKLTDRRDTGAMKVIEVDDHDFYVFFPENSTQAALALVPIKEGEEAQLKDNQWYTGIFKRTNGCDNQIEPELYDAVNRLAEQTKDADIAHTLNVLGYSGMSKEVMAKLQRKKYAEQEIWLNAHDGNFTVDDIEDIQRLFGISLTHNGNDLILHEFNRGIYSQVFDAQRGVFWDKLFNSITTIEVDAYFRDTGITSLGNLQIIGGSVDFEGSSIALLGNLQIIKGDAYFEYSSVTSLGNLQSIGGRADFRKSDITSLGNLQSIGGDANFSESSIPSLGNLQSIGGYAFFRKSRITSLGNLQIIKGDAYFEGRSITSLGNLQSIGESANFRNSSITSLGNLQSIGEGADFEGSSIPQSEQASIPIGTAEAIKKSEEIHRRVIEAIESQNTATQPSGSGIWYQFLGEQVAANLDKAEEVTTRLDNLQKAREMEDGKSDR